MTTKQSHCPNPRRVAAGRKNRLKRRGLTAAGAEKLRQAALLNQPWSRSTGPRTEEGKARAARNGKLRQKGKHSVRELRAELAGVQSLIDAVSRCRSLLGQPREG